jgi:uncharacterized membrane protein YhhN
MRGKAGLLVVLSLLCGLSYPLLWDQLPAAADIALKGAGVGLLSLAALSRARGLDGRLLAALMALGATGDMLLEISLAAGAAAFAAGHVLAILLYRRNRREENDQTDVAMAGLILIVAPALSLILLQGRPEAPAFTAYGLLLGAMAASAWLSRFPRTLVATGALLFLGSDMLIAFRMASDVAGLAAPIWLLYYVGQLLIFVGVTSSLAAKPVGRGTVRSMVEG